MNLLATDQGFVLGLDIGARSVGWAIVQKAAGRPVGILGLGSRVFEAGVEGSTEQGKEESRSAQRRTARLQRRQLERRRRRRNKVYNLLAKKGFLPAVDLEDRQALHTALDRIDRQLTPRYVAADDHVANQLLPYILRARALDSALEPMAFGRAIYQLSQRRGYRSNRKADRSGNSDADDELGKVKAGIQTLRGEIQAAGMKTLGQYLAGLDPTKRRIRSRWTARDMYEQEFAAICDHQREHHPALTPDFEKELRDALFQQRELKSQRGLVGMCPLEVGQRRTTMAKLEAQRFRLLQKVNDLEILYNDGRREPLTETQRIDLARVLEAEGDIALSRCKTLLGLKRGQATLNLEAGGEKRLPGNRTAAKLRECFGTELWSKLSPQDRAQVVEDHESIREAQVLADRGRNKWGLNMEQSASFGDLELEVGYSALSLKAIRQLLPLLENGVSYSAARKKEYPQSFKSSEPKDSLPPANKALNRLRNPAVTRALSETRKVVQSILREHGKPDAIHIELARDLKQPRKVREDRWKASRERERERKHAIAQILEKSGNTEPRAGDIEKVLLAEECGWHCPYTGRCFGWKNLLGKDAEVEVEHILPYSRSLDNSFLNKTLCWSEENRNKHSRTPYEAYGGDAKRWDEILDRVRSFQGPDRVRRAKLERFLCQELGEERLDAFAESQLNDTRLASLEAADYLGILYGGRVDGSGRMRVFTSAGGATAILRQEWGLNGLLNPNGDSKTREDHRHHAVDALVVALTGPAEVQSIARAAAAAATAGSRRRLSALEPPWKNLREDAGKRLDGVIASHRCNRVLRGKLHQDTLHSPAMEEFGKGNSKGEVRHVRKLLHTLKEGDIDCIVDDRIRALVRAALNKSGMKDPAKAFAQPETHPVLPSRRGPIPIHKVRVAKRMKLISVGQGVKERFVAPGSNHHMAIVAVVGADGKDQKWEGHVVTRLEANRRFRFKEPIVQRDWGPGKSFRFSLAAGDCVGKAGDGSEQEVYSVRGVSDGDIEWLAANDARPSGDIRKAGVKGGRKKGGPEALRKAGLTKVVVSPLGMVSRAHD